jgi:hypothetical protein
MKTLFAIFTILISFQTLANCKPEAVTVKIEDKILEAETLCDDNVTSSRLAITKIASLKSTGVVMLSQIAPKEDRSDLIKKVNSIVKRKSFNIQEVKFLSENIFPLLDKAIDASSSEEEFEYLDLGSEKLKEFIHL